MPTPPDTPPAPPDPTPRAQLRKFGDHAAVRAALYQNALQAARALPPVENSRYRLHLQDVGYAPGHRDFTPADEKQALLGRRTLARRLIGTAVLTDRATGRAVDTKRLTLAHVPHLGESGDFILDGSPYVLSHQLRLDPGVYVRRKQSGDTEAHVNAAPGTGVQHRLRLDRETGALKVDVGQAELPAFPLLRALGASEADLRSALGDDLYARNARAAKPQHLAALYDRLGPKGRPRPADGELAQALGEHLRTYRLDPWVTRRTLGVAKEHYDQDVALAAVKKVLAVTRGHAEPDDRDSLAYQSLHGPEHTLPERLARAGPVLQRLLTQVTHRGNLAPLQPGALNPAVRSVFMTSGLGQNPEGVNALERVDHGARVTKVGEGGIGRSSDAVPESAREVSPSQYLFIDPIKTSESENVGLDLRTSFGTRLGTDKRIYAPVYDVKAQRLVYRNPRQMAEQVLAFPGPYERGEAVVPAVVRGKLGYVPRDQVTHVAPSHEQSFGALTNLIPLKSNSKPHRSSMGARYWTQALPLVHREAPLVQSAVPGQPDKSFVELYGRHAGAVHAKPQRGVVEAVDPHGVTVRYDDGTTETHALHAYHPAGRATMLHNTPVVKPGESVAPGQLLATSNNTDDRGRVAVGVNARVAYLPYIHGHHATYEDASIISQDLANKLTSEHLYPHHFEPDADTLTGRDAYISAFPGRHPLEHYKNYDEKGVVKPGTVLEPDQPLVLAVRRDAGSYGILKSRRAGLKDAAVRWEHETPGRVVDVVPGPRGSVTVSVLTHKPFQTGDKLSGSHGNKGIASVLPSELMPHDKDGKPFDILMSPLGITSRTNPAQLYEAWLGKVAAKTGVPYKVADDGSVADRARYVQGELARHGVPDQEDVTDPRTGRVAPSVTTGNMYVMKLSHTAAKKVKGHGIGGYDESGTPQRGPEGASRMSMGDTMALLGHGSLDILRDLRMYRGQDNAQMWAAYMAGFPPPRATVDKPYQRFLDLLRGAGVQPLPQGHKTRLMALTPADVDQLAGDRVLKNAETVNLGTGKPLPGGLFDPDIFGASDSPTQWAKLPLAEPVLNPVFEDPARRLLGLTEAGLRDVIAGRKTLPGGGTGPQGLADALRRVNVPAAIKEQRELLASTRKTARDEAARKLAYLKGLEANGQTPADWLLHAAPVLPPALRPVRELTGNRRGLVVNDTNLLYRELYSADQAVRHLRGRVTDLSDERLGVYDALKAVVGLGEATDPRNVQREVKGILKQVFPGSSKRCFDADTEIRTQRGWVRFPELTADDVVATLNPTTGAFEWQRPTEIQRYRQQGEMIRFYSHTTWGVGSRGAGITEKGRITPRLDLLVTPGHRNWLRRPTTKPYNADIETGWRFETAVETAGRGSYKDVYMRAAASGWHGTYTRPEFLPESADRVAFASLVGWYLAEGSIHTSGGSVEIPQMAKNTDGCAAISNAVTAVSLRYSQYSREIKHRGNAICRTWSVRSRALADWLATNCGVGSTAKWISREILDWPVEMLTALYLGYMGGDGGRRLHATVPSDKPGKKTHRHRSTLNDKFNRVGTCSQRLFDDLTEVCCKLGTVLRTGVVVPPGRYKNTENKSTVYTGCVDGHRMIGLSGVKSEVVYYDGYVYCCTVPNGIVFVRRNGAPVFSGNSYVQQRLLGTPADLSGRGQIAPNADLDMDQIGLPEHLAWRVYSPFVVRRLVRSGVPRTEALRQVLERGDRAKAALLEELEVRPVTATRYPVLDKYGVQGFRPQLVAGDALHINPTVIRSLGGDFDGNCCVYGTKIYLAFLPEVCYSSPLSPEQTATVEEWYMRLVHDEHVYLHDGVVYARVPIGSLPRVGVPTQDRNGADVYTLPPGFTVLTYDHATGGVRYAQATELTVEKGVSCAVVKTRHDYAVEVSDNESLAVFDPDTGELAKRKPADAIGLFIPRTRRIPQPGTAYTREIGWWYGALVADGWVSDRIVGYSKNDPTRRQEFVRVAEHVFGVGKFTISEYKEAVRANKYAESAKMHLYFSDRQLLTRVLNVYRGEAGVGRNALRKGLPRELLNGGSREALLGLFAGLLDGDAYTGWNTHSKNKRFVCRFLTSSPHLRDDLIELGMRLGVRMSVTATPPRNKSAESYTVCPSVVDLHRLAPELRPVCTQTRADLAELAARDTPLDNQDVIPLARPLADAMRARLLGLDRHLYGVVGKHLAEGCGVVRRTAQRLIDTLDPEFTHAQYAQFKSMVATEDVCWERITDVTPTDKQEVFDLVVPDTKVFVTGDGLVIYDTMSIHVPFSDAAVRSAYETMLPSRNLLSPATRKADVYVPHMEFGQGLHHLSTAWDGGRKPEVFRSRKDAIAAYNKGLIRADTPVEILEDKRP